jgi:hypothetical protein
MCLGPRFAQHFGQQQQLVVVHPDGIIWPSQSQHGFTKFLIYRLVGLPVPFFIKRIFAEVVESRPQRAVAKALVVVADFVFRQKHGGHAVVVQLLGHVALLLGVVHKQAWPADPHVAIGPVDGA